MYKLGKDGKIIKDELVEFERLAKLKTSKEILEARKWWHDITQAYFNTINRDIKWTKSQELFDRVDKYFFDKYCLESERCAITDEFTK